MSLLVAFTRGHRKLLEFDFREEGTSFACLLGQG